MPKSSKKINYFGDSSSSSDSEQEKDSNNKDIDTIEREKEIIEKEQIKKNTSGIQGFLLTNNISTTNKQNNETKTDKKKEDELPKGWLDNNIDISDSEEEEDLKKGKKKKSIFEEEQEFYLSSSSEIDEDKLMEELNNKLFKKTKKKRIRLNRLKNKQLNTQTINKQEEEEEDNNKQEEDNNEISEEEEDDDDEMEIDEAFKMSTEVDESLFTMKPKRVFHSSSNKEEKENKKNENILITDVEDADRLTPFPHIENWKSFGLDRRLLISIHDIGFHEPTRIQQIAIPIILGGRDVICNSPTGTGKTAAILIPILQMILQERNVVREFNNDLNNLNNQKSKVIYFAPTNELCSQVYQQWKVLAKYCQNECPCLVIDANFEVENFQRMNPSIIITTPENLLKFLKYDLQISNSNTKLLKESLKLIVIDEGDHIMNKQQELIKTIIQNYFSGLFQCILSSATMEEKEAITLKEYLLKNPIRIKLNRKENYMEGKLIQYYIQLKQKQGYREELSMTYYLIRHKFYGGRVIVYVSTNRLLKVYTTLRSLGINCVMFAYYFPTISKLDIIKLFNQNKYQVLVATMETEEMLLGHSEGKSALFNVIENDLVNHIKRKEHTQYGIENTQLARGIDFQRVAGVIYFDLPNSLTQYIHGVGRTARAGNVGISITLVTPHSSAHWLLLKGAIEKNYEQEIEEYPYIDDHSLVYEKDYTIGLIESQMNEPALIRQSLQHEMNNANYLKEGKSANHEMRLGISIRNEDFKNSNNQLIVKQDPILLKAGMLANITSEGNLIKSQYDTYSKTKDISKELLPIRTLNTYHNRFDPLYQFQNPFIELSKKRLEKTFLKDGKTSYAMKEKIKRIKTGLERSDLLLPHKKYFKDGLKGSDNNGDENNEEDMDEENKEERNEGRRYFNKSERYNDNKEESSRGGIKDFIDKNSNYNNNNRRKNNDNNAPKDYFEKVTRASNTSKKFNKFSNK
ncbi:hypothetical protein ABK040_006344 [Willaertia magna]